MPRIEYLAIDSVVVASSFDLWFRILQNIVTFRLDRGERYVKGVARFARVKLALAGWFIDSVPFPLYSLPFTRFAHALHITQSYEIADVLVTEFSRVDPQLFDVFEGTIIGIFQWFIRECISLVIQVFRNIFSSINLFILARLTVFAFFLSFFF